MATNDISPQDPAQGFGNDPMIDPKTGELRGHCAGADLPLGHGEDLPRIVLTSHTPLGWFFGFVIGGQPSP